MHSFGNRSSVSPRNQSMISYRLPQHQRDQRCPQQQQQQMLHFQGLDNGYMQCETNIRQVVQQDFQQRPCYRQQIQQGPVQQNSFNYPHFVYTGDYTDILFSLYGYSATRTRNLQYGYNGFNRTGGTGMQTTLLSSGWLNENPLLAGKYVFAIGLEKYSDDVRPEKIENEVAVEKRNFTDEMLTFTRRNFPNLHSAVYHVPPLRFNRVQEEKLKEYYNPGQDVFLQRESVHSDVTGDSTDDVVMQCVSHVLSSNSPAAFVLHNYSFDDYLCKTVREVHKQYGMALFLKNRCTKSVSESKISGNKSQSNGLHDPDIQRRVKTGRNQNRKQMSAKGRGQNPKDVFLTPKNLRKCPVRGDFDCLIVSPTFGFIILESKTLDPFARFIKQGGRIGTSANHTLVHCRIHSDTTPIDNVTERQDDGDDVKNDHFQSSDDVSVHVEEGERVSTGFKNIFVHDMSQTNNNQKTTTFLPESESHHFPISSDCEPDVIEGGQKITPTSEFKRLKENANVFQTMYYAGDIETFRWKIKRAMSQLDKAEMVLRHIVSDLSGDVTITKTLALPSMGRSLLRKVLDDPDMKREICTCLKVATLEDVLLRCLCAEEAKVVSDKFHKDIENSSGITPTTNPLTEWWAGLTRSIGNGLYSKARDMSDDISREQSLRNENEKLSNFEILPYDTYEQIIARFCGPYSRASIGHRQGAKDEIRTAEESIHLTGVRFGRSILRSEQKDILDSDDRFVIIVGPPGAGKTLILALKALEWAKKGDHVVVICNNGVNYGSLVSWILYNRVRDTMTQTEKDKRKLENQGNKNYKQIDENDIQGKGSIKRKEVTCKIRKRKERGGTVAESNLKFETTSPNRKEDKGKNYTSRVDKEDRGVNFQDQSKETEKDKKPFPVYAENVHCERISVETDLDEFVQNLLVRYGDKPLRLIVDECPEKVTKESQLHKLAECLSKLQDVYDLYNKLLQVLRDDSVRTRSTDSQAHAHTEKKGDNKRGECHSTGNALHYGTLSGELSKRNVCTGNTCTAQHSTLQHKTQCTGYSAEYCTRTGDTCQHDTRKRDKDEYSTHPGNLYRNPETHLDSIDIQYTMSNSWSAQQSGTSSKLYSGKKSLHSLEVNKPNSHPSEKSAEQNLEFEKQSCTEHLYFSIGKYLTRMENYIVTLSARIQQLQTDNGAARVMLGDSDWDWENSLAQIRDVFLKIKDRKRECDKQISEMNSCGAVRSEDVKGMLEQIDRGMILAMGFAFKAYNYFAFFMIQTFFSKIVERHSLDPSREISLWGSCAFTFQIPAEMKEKKLTTCIRCPPNVQQVMRFIGDKLKLLPDINLITTGGGVNPPLPTAGPRVRLFNHAQHVARVQEIHDCVACGMALADFLLDHLNVGKPGSKLAAHDVVITGSPIHQTAQCAFIQVLIERGLAIQYENQALTTPPPYQDKVLVIGGSNLQGLEAKIVVYVPEVRRVLEAKCGEEPSDPTPVQDIRQCLSRLDDWNLKYLWMVASRTVSLLTIFHV